MNRFIPFLLPLLLIVTACTSNEQVVKPTVKPLTEAVYASGFVVAKDEYDVYPEVEGYLEEKLVNDGDAVKKGDALFIISANQQSARYRIAKENYELAAKNFANNSPVLNELIAAQATAKSKMQFDSVNVVRYTNLLKNHATTQLEYDRMKLAYENSKNEYALQTSRLARTKNQLQADYQNAKHQLQISSDESGRYIIKSEIDGIVFKTIKEKGELIRRNEVIALIGSENNFYLQLSVDELDIERVKLNQPVVVKIDAYPNKIFHAVVKKIYPLVNQQQQSFRVDASLEETLPNLFSGLAVEANIVIYHNDKALVIPKTALLENDSVSIKADDGDKKIKVIKGASTLDEVEIISGLDSSMQLNIVP